MEATESLSLSSILADQSRLLKQAARALPYSANKCTHDEPGGYIRQAVYLCKTCAGGEGKMGKGICAACSVSCHADHEQLELFPKRAFQCDCPTCDIPVKCTLHVGPEEPPNDQNVYGQNFRGEFCRCSRHYDPMTETETMIQCVACDDWWHESCLNLLGAPVARTPKSSPTKNPRAAPSPPPQPSSEADYMTDGDDDEEYEEEGELKLIPSSGYESLVCGSCVASIPALRRWAGTKGVRMIVRKKAQTINVRGTPVKTIDFRGWEVLGEADDRYTEDQSNSSTLTQSNGEHAPKKRSASPSPASSEHPNKKIKLSDTVAKPACKAPQPNPLAQCVFDRLDKRKAKDSATKPDRQSDLLVVDEEEEYNDEVDGEGDIFLSEGWRERWCGCEECLPLFRPHHYLLEEEDTYVPPEDPDSKKSLEELGLRALQNLPRDKALDSIRAFNEMRDELLEYLKPFAEEGKVVSEQDVTAFFEALKEGKLKATS